MSGRPPFSPARPVWFLLGLMALGAGMAGVVLPLVPTTPFILLAAFAFARSSPRLHDWLLAHRVFGPLIADWRAHGAIRRPAKVVSMVSIVIVAALSLIMGVPLTVFAIQLVALGLVVAFILSRPSPPADGAG